MNNPIEPPTAQELRDLLKKHSLVRHEAATLLHVSTSALNKWTATGREHRQIPLAIYELLLLKLDEHPTKKLVDR